MKKIVIAKFGGTSVSTKERVENICRIVHREKERNPVVVVSALSKVTDMLIASSQLPVLEREKKIVEIESLHATYIADIFSDAKKAAFCGAFVKESLALVRRLLEEGVSDKKSLDRLVSYGEIMSSFLIAQAITDSGLKAEQVVATDIIVTDGNHGSAEFLVSETEELTRAKILPLLEKGIVPVVTGFIGLSKEGFVTTLGRGGSDYTASILGYCLDAEEIQIWTDVDGIYTSDPRFVQGTYLIPEVSYKEAAEMAFFGAKVLHPRTMRPAIKKSIPLLVLNTLKPEGKGTRVVEKPSYSNPIVAISFKKKVALVNMYSTDMLFSKGFLVRIFDIFAKQNISIDLVSVSEVSVSVTLDNEEHLAKAVQELKVFTEVHVTHGLGIISLVGEGIPKSPRVIDEMFHLLSEMKILVRMISLGATSINVSLVIDSDNIERVTAELHDKLLVKEMTKKL